MVGNEREGGHQGHQGHRGHRAWQALRSNCEVMREESHTRSQTPVTSAFKAEIGMKPLYPTKTALLVDEPSTSPYCGQASAAALQTLVATARTHSCSQPIIVALSATKDCGRHSGPEHGPADRVSSCAFRVPAAREVGAIGDFESAVCRWARCVIRSQHCPVGVWAPRRSWRPACLLPLLLLARTPNPNPRRRTPRQPPQHDGSAAKKGADE
jgi:hypothetical protein